MIGNNECRADIKNVIVKPFFNLRNRFQIKSTAIGWINGVSFVDKDTSCSGGEHDGW